MFLMSFRLGAAMLIILFESSKSVYRAPCVKFLDIGTYNHQGIHIIARFQPIVAGIQFTDCHP